MGAKLFGASVLRKEDPRFLRGDGRYVDDIKLPGLLHAAFVRSPYAHAVIRSIKLEAARRLRGIAHVFAFAELERWMKPLPLFGAVPPGLAACVSWGRSWPWCSRRVAPWPRMAASWSRSSTNRCPWSPTWWREPSPTRP